MTIDALHGTVDRPLDPSTGGAAIGAPDANIFLCPRCTRPLAVGVSRCAGCKTRLVAGVPLLKVSGFVGLGMIAGLAIVGGIVGALTLAGRWDVHSGCRTTRRRPIRRPCRAAAWP